MAVTITNFAPGLWSANALGAAFLSSTVTPATFRGMPIVGVCRDQTFAGTSASYAPLQALVDFAAVYNAPLVVFDSVSSFDPPNSAYVFLRTACDNVGRFFDSAQSRKPRVVQPGFDFPVVMSGPWISVSATPSAITDGEAFAWQYAQLFARTSQYHPYRVGMTAVSAFSTNNYYMSPPIYTIGPGYAADFKQLDKKWSGQAVVSAQQCTDLLTAQAGYYATLQLTPTGKLNTVFTINIVGFTGNNVTIAVTADSTDPRGYATVVSNNITLHYLSGSTTVGDLEALFPVSVTAGVISVKDTAASSSAVLLSPTDTYIATNFSGGYPANPGLARLVNPVLLPYVSLRPPNF